MSLHSLNHRTIAAALRDEVLFFVLLGLRAAADSTEPSPRDSLSPQPDAEGNLRDTGSFVNPANGGGQQAEQGGRESKGRKIDLASAITSDTEIHVVSEQEGSMVRRPPAPVTKPLSVVENGANALSFAARPHSLTTLRRGRLSTSEPPRSESPQTLRSFSLVAGPARMSDVALFANARTGASSRRSNVSRCGTRWLDGTSSSRTTLARCYTCK